MLVEGFMAVEETRDRTVLSTIRLSTLIAMMFWRSETDKLLFYRVRRADEVAEAFDQIGLLLYFVLSLMYPFCSLLEESCTLVIYCYCKYLACDDLWLLSVIFSHVLFLESHPE